VRRLDVPDLDPFLTILAGEILFNARSALDHLVGALILPEKRTRWIVHHAQFPIFTNDIDAADPATGKYLNGPDRGRWEAMTKGLAPDAIDAIKFFQPYHFARDGIDSAHSSMTILNDLQNADKHRQLVIGAQGVADPRSGSPTRTTAELRNRPPTRGRWASWGTEPKYTWTPSTSRRT
jgi:hypothetical protein